ncbi:MAG: hypothetical protein ABR501_01200 [Pyrinomonadaceae bacterium]
MNTYQGQPLPPNDVQPQANSNKKLWIILASVSGLLVIVMGGCVACGGLYYLSTLNNGNLASSDSDPNSNEKVQSTSTRRNETGAPGTLGGTTWKGNLNCDDGDNVPVVFRFAESGDPIYEYQTNNGAREVELTAPGQIVRFVPSGGGVTSVEVDALSVSSDRVSHAVSISHEGGSGATLEQSRARVATEITLSGSDLTVETKIRSQSAISQPGIVVPGDEHVVTCSGKLRQD